MLNLALRTEYSFKKTFGKLKDVVKYTNGHKAIGIADINNTFGHVKFEKICRKNKLNPVFGVRLEVVEDYLLRVRSHYGPVYIFIAKNTAGLSEIYDLVKQAYDNFYYKPMVPLSTLLTVSSDVFVICQNPGTVKRIDYIALSPSTPKLMLDISSEFDIPVVAINDNAYSKAIDKEAYQLLAGARKHGDGFRYMFNEQTYPQHILTKAEHNRLWGISSSYANTLEIAEQCDVSIPSASMVKYHSKVDFKKICRMGALKLKIPIEGKYKARFERELELIEKKGYTDYFLIVAEMIKKAKKKMLVGPARGSSAGSLVCYFLGITSVDPLKHGLLFERFIDINRDDLPDIDIDFPDTRRQSVIKDLFKTYGKDNVYHISNINTLGARSALDEFGMSLSIPKYKVEQVKDSIVDRSGGDARAAVAVADTLDTTEIGKEFLAEYPKIGLVRGAEGHATHAGKHAAGIIVCNDELTKFCGVNTRESTIMMDKKDAEAKNLLKIDCLGLRTLTILEEAAELAGKPFDFYYSLPIDNKATFGIFTEMRLQGIFQFEGQSMQMLCDQMGVENFNDIVAITALARPGPLHSGAANIYIKRRIGEKEIECICQHPEYIKETKDTMGVIVYQEQLMNLCRNVGNMSWEDVSEIRKAASKTLGKEFFDQYRDKFLSGAKDNKIEESEAVEVWENMMTFGSWGMNKSHSVSYAYISYWCAYMKAHHPLEFTVATLNNSKDESSAIKILRDAVEKDGLEYSPVDPDESSVNWTIHNGMMLGGLVNIKGIAEKKAKEIISKRAGGSLPPGLMKKLMYPETPYDILYPCRHYWGALYDTPQKYGLSAAPSFLGDIKDTEGEYTAIGKVISKDLRDLNEYNELVKRGGKVLADNHLFLRIVIEDDTGQIMCKINRFDFENLDGQGWSESLIPGESWVIIKGKISQGWRILNINAIFDLKELEI